MGKGDLGGQRILIKQLEEYKVISVHTVCMKSG